MESEGFAFGFVCLLDCLLGYAWGAADRCFYFGLVFKSLIQVRGRGCGRWILFYLGVTSTEELAAA